MFKNRNEAAQKLAQEIQKHQEIQKKGNLVIMGIPRGGVILSQVISHKLECPMDVIVVKKITPPHNEELAMGAIGETKGSQHLNNRIIDELNIKKEYLQKEIVKKEKEIKKRESFYRQKSKAVKLKNRTVIIVDDGAATGETMIAAAREVWNHQPKKVIAAVPVISRDALEKLEKEVDEVIYLNSPELFFAVGQFYKQFDQVDDPQVLEILEKTKNE